jgi:HEAT repeat protein
MLRENAKLEARQREVEDLRNELVSLYIKKLVSGEMAFDTEAQAKVIQIGAPAVPQILAAVGSSSDDSVLIPGTAVIILEGMGPPAVRGLVSGLSSTEETVRLGAVRAFSLMVKKLTPATIESSIPSLVKLLAQSRQNTASVKAAAILTEIGEPAIPQLAKELTAPPSFEAVFPVLFGMGYAGRQGFMRAYPMIKRREHKLIALAVLVQAGEREAAPLFRSASDDPDEDVRKLAKKAFAE